MTEKIKQTKGSEAPAGNGNAEAVMAMNGAAFDVFTRACQAYFNGWATVNSEIAGFMAKRLTHDAELNASLAGCTTWEQAAELQRGWAQETAEEYFEEANRLMVLASRVTFDQWQPVWQRADEAFTSAAKTTT